MRNAQNGICSNAKEDWRQSAKHANSKLYINSWKKRHQIGRGSCHWCPHGIPDDNFDKYFLKQPMRYSQIIQAIFVGSLMVAQSELMALQK